LERVSRWRPDQLPSYAGKRVIVTGANSGIGLHTAAALAAKGARVTLACRDQAKGEQAARQMAGEARVERLDLSSLASVAAFVQRWTEPLDLLVNNAGVMTPPRWQATEDGFELQFGTNHLGHMALTSALMPWLLSAPAARVVTVASIAHHGGTRAVLEGNPPETYKPEPAYGNSKLANLLFARELHRRLTERGMSVTSTAAHPGVAATGLVTDRQGMGANPLVRVLGPVLLPVVLAPAKAGAEAPLYAAAVAEPGSYTGPTGRGEWRGPVGPARLSALAADDGLAAELWARSEELLGRPFAWS
jgi:NAD(P)-dependent dehydrogenase (short-subunit alcohol dehydrogenase family)